MIPSLDVHQAIARGSCDLDATLAAIGHDEGRQSVQGVSRTDAGHGRCPGQAYHRSAGPTSTAEGPLSDVAGSNERTERATAGRG